LKSVAKDEVVLDDDDDDEEEEHNDTIGEVVVIDVP
jgi:hypothetical protein